MIESSRFSLNNVDIITDELDIPQNPYYVVFASAHEVPRTAAALFFIVLVQRLYTSPSHDVLRLLKSVVYWFELEEKFVVSVADAILDKHMDGEDCTSDFRFLDNLDDDQVTLFTALYFRFTRDAMHENEPATRRKQALLTMLLPARIQSHIFHKDYNELNRKIAGVMTKVKSHTF